MTNDEYTRVHDAALAPVSAVLLDRELMRGVTANGSIHAIEPAHAADSIQRGFELATGGEKLCEGPVFAQACRGGVPAIRAAGA